MTPPPPKALMDAIMEQLATLQKVAGNARPKHPVMVDASMDLTRRDPFGAIATDNLEGLQRLTAHFDKIMGEQQGAINARQAERAKRKMLLDAGVEIPKERKVSEIYKEFKPRFDKLAEMKGQEIQRPGSTLNQPLPAMVAGLGLQGWEGASQQEPPAPQSLLSQVIDMINAPSRKVGEVVTPIMQAAGEAQKEAWKKFLKNPTAEGSVDIAGDLAMPMAGSLKFVPKFMREENVINFAKAKEELGELLRDRLVRGGRHPLEGQKQRIDFRHSTNRLFKDPVIEPSVAGGGAGDQWQGQGFYITEEPKVSEFYRGITAREIPPQFQLEDGSGAINLRKLDNFISDMDNDSFSKHFHWLDGLRRKLREGTNPKFSDAPLGMQTMPDYITKKLAEIEALGAHPPKGQSPFEYRNKRAALVRELRSNIDHYNRMSRDWQNNQQYGGMIKGVPRQTAEATYSGNFYANPDELFDLQLPLDQQPASQRVMGALNQFSYGAAGEPLGDYLAAAQRGVGDPRLAYDINESLVRHGKDVNSGVTQGPILPPTFGPSTILSMTSEQAMAEPGQFISQRLNPWKVMEALRDKGIVGNKYLTRFAAEGLAPPSHNYVVTDPARVRLNDVWSILGMLGGGAAAAQTIKGKKDDPKGSKPPRS